LIPALPGYIYECVYSLVRASMNKTYDSIIFNDHLGQAVRLPQAIALPEHVERVEIVVIGIP